MDDYLKIHLEKYKLLAIELGMSDAIIISAEDVLIDPRVRLKCRYPRCGYYGTNGNCPPYATDLDEIKACVKQYQYGIFIMKETYPEELLGKKKIDHGNAKPGNTQALIYKAVRAIESAAFKDGYELAMGFGNGPCKKLFCADKECTAIKPGGSCRAPLYSRSSMEGCGMRVYEMARRAGWDIEPAGAHTCPDEITKIRAFGLVLID